MLHNYNAPVKILIAVGLWGVLGSVVGCSSAPKLADDKAYWELRVQQRAQARWQAIVSKNYADAYVYYSEPSRQGFTQDMFARQMAAVETRGATVRSVNCNSERCAANIETSVEYSIPRIGKRVMTLPVDEMWIVNNNEAYLVRR